MVFGIRFKFALYLTSIVELKNEIVPKIQFYINHVSHRKLVHKIYLRNSILLIVVRKLSYSLSWNLHSKTCLKSVVQE